MESGKGGMRRRVKARARQQYGVEVGIGIDADGSGCPLQRSDACCPLCNVPLALHCLSNSTRSVGTQTPWGASVSSYVGDSQKSASASVSASVSAFAGGDGDSGSPDNKIHPRDGSVDARGDGDEHEHEHDHEHVNEDEDRIEDVDDDQDTETPTTLLLKNEPVARDAVLPPTTGTAFGIAWPRHGSLVALLWDPENQFLHWMKRRRCRGGRPEKPNLLAQFVPLRPGCTYEFYLLLILPETDAAPGPVHGLVAKQANQTHHASRGSHASTTTTPGPTIVRRRGPVAIARSPWQLSLYVTMLPRESRVLDCVRFSVEATSDGSTFYSSSTSSSSSSTTSSISSARIDAVSPFSLKPPTQENIAATDPHFEQVDDSMNETHGTAAPCVIKDDDDEDDKEDDDTDDGDDDSDGDGDGDGNGSEGTNDADLDAGNANDDFRGHNRQQQVCSEDDKDGASEDEDDDDDDDDDDENDDDDDDDDDDYDDDENDDDHDYADANTSSEERQEGGVAYARRALLSPDAAVSDAEATSPVNDTDPRYVTIAPHACVSARTPGRRRRFSHVRQRPRTYPVQ